MSLGRRVFLSFSRVEIALISRIFSNQSAVNDENSIMESSEGAWNSIDNVLVLLLGLPLVPDAQALKNSTTSLTNKGNGKSREGAVVV